MYILLVLMQMKSRRSALQEAEPPSPDSGRLAIFTLIVLLGIFISLGIVWFVTEPPPKPREIHVGSKVCTIRFVTTGRRCTSTGSCSPVGYDEAVCPP